MVFRSTREVQWEDVDLSGTVHFATYVRYMEETEYEFLRSRGIQPVVRDSRGTLGFPRVAAQLEIIEPARFQEVLDIELRVEDNDGVRVKYRFEIRCRRRSVAHGEFDVVCCRFVKDEPPRAILLPDHFLEAVPRTDRPPGW